MNSRCEKNGRFSLGLLAAMAAPLAHTASRESWLTVLAAGFAVLGVSLLRNNTEDAERSGKVCAVLRWIWITIVLSQTAHWVMTCWKDYESYEAIPLTLLALGAWAAAKGDQVIKRVGGVLFWGLLILLAAIGVSATKDVKIVNLRPVWTVPDGTFLTVLLIPCIILSQSGKDNNRGEGIALWAYAIGVSVVTTGVLSLEVARQVQSPVYELGRSVSVLGFAERIESLVAAAMTLGYFVLTGCLLGRAGEAAGNVEKKWHKPGVWISAAAAGGLLIWGIRINGIVLAGGIVLLWICCPLCGKMADKINFKKSKKSP